MASFVSARTTTLKVPLSTRHCVDGGRPTSSFTPHRARHLPILSLNSPLTARLHVSTTCTPLVRTTGAPAHCRVRRAALVSCSANGQATAATEAEPAKEEDEVRYYMRNTFKLTDSQIQRSVDFLAKYVPILRTCPGCMAASLANVEQLVVAS